MTASPIVLVKDGSGSFTAFTNGMNVTPGNTISVKLQSTTDVTQWALQIFGVDEVTVTAPALTGVNATTHLVATPSTVVTFTMPSGSGVARALLFRSSVNGGGSGFTSNFGVYTLTSLGRRVGAVGERLEGDAEFGWAATVNAALRSTGGGGGGGDLPDLANQQYAVLMEDPIGSLVFQRITKLSTPDGSDGDGFTPGGTSEGVQVFTGTGGTDGGAGGGTSGSVDIYSGDGADGVGLQNPQTAGSVNIFAGNAGAADTGASPVSGGFASFFGGSGSEGSASAPGGVGGQIDVSSGDGGNDGGQDAGRGGISNFLSGRGGNSLSGRGGDGGPLNVISGIGSSGANGSDGGGAGGPLVIETGSGGGAGTPSGHSGTGGDGGDLEINTGRGGDGTQSGAAGRGGDLSITTGRGGDGFGANAGRGGNLNITLGDGRASSPSGASPDGGSFDLEAGNGAAGSSDSSGGPGGRVIITAGHGGDDGSGHIGGGDGGYIVLIGAGGGDSVGGPAGKGSEVSLSGGDGGDGTASVASGNGGNISLYPGIPGTENGGGSGTQGVVYIRTPENAVTPGELRFEDLDFSNYTGIRAADVTTSSGTYKLPPADGTSGQVLTTNGARALSWATASGGSGDASINVAQTIESNSPTTIHTYSDPGDEARGTVCYDLMVSSIGPDGGNFSCFKLIATFERDGSTFTEQDVTFINGPVRSNPAYDVTFDLDGLDINLQVTGVVNGEGGIRWRALGTITVVNATFAEA